MPIELEQKYVVVSERPWTVQAELLALLRRAGYGVELQGEKVQRDTYYDTPEDRRRLARWLGRFVIGLSCLMFLFLLLLYFT